MSPLEEQQLKKAMEECHKWEQEVQEHNTAIIKAMGAHAQQQFNEIIDGCRITNKIELVAKPDGNKQREKYAHFQEIWVHQWSTGMEGDTFAGFIYARVSLGKWLKIAYDC